MGIQVLPEAAPEGLTIRRPAGPDGREQGSPGVRHPAAKAIEIKAEAELLVEQRSRSVVQSEPARRRLFEHALAHQVPEHPAKRVGIGAGSGRKLADVGAPRRDAVSDPQCCHNVDAPRRAKIAEAPDIHKAMMTRESGPT